MYIYMLIPKLYIHVDVKLQADSPAVTDPNIATLARGPSKKVRTDLGYFVNGYRFHTRAHTSTRATDSSGVVF